MLRGAAWEGPCEYAVLTDPGPCEYGVLTGPQAASDAPKMIKMSQIGVGKYMIPIINMHIYSMVLT